MLALTRVNASMNGTTIKKGTGRHGA